MSTQKLLLTRKPISTLVGTICAERQGLWFLQRLPRALPSRFTGLSRQPLGQVLPLSLFHSRGNWDSEVPRALSKIFQGVSHRERGLCSPRVAPRGPSHPPAGPSCGPVASQDPARRRRSGRIPRVLPQVSTVSFTSCVTPEMPWKATEAPYTQALTCPRKARGRRGSPRIEPVPVS